MEVLVQVEVETKLRSAAGCCFEGFTMVLWMNCRPVEVPRLILETEQERWP